MARLIAISALDISTVIFPLQYVPLFDARQLGTITYRALLIATGEVKPRTGEEKLAASAIIEARGGAGPAALAPARKHIAMLKSALDRIRNAFAVRGTSAGLDNVAALVAKNPSLHRSRRGSEGSAHRNGGKSGRPIGSAGVGVWTHVRLPKPARLLPPLPAITALGNLRARICPLVRQAHQLIGKSFIEVISILVPNHMEKAAFRIGRRESVRIADRQAVRFVREGRAAGQRGRSRDSRRFCGGHRRNSPQFPGQVEGAGDRVARSSAAIFSFL